jgi:Protein of unknown function (DUF3053)
MIAFNRRVACVAALILLAAGLTACGENEPDQRKAFIKFLQEINARTGVHFLIAKPEEVKAFGDYARHYAIIVDFNKDMGAISGEFLERLKKLGYGATAQRTLEQMAANPKDLDIVKDENEKIQRAIETRLARLNSERAALKQPDDLKAVYDKTFDKLVTAPTQAIKDSNKALAEGHAAASQLVDYINSHRSRLTVSGGQVRTNDARILAEVNVLLKAHQDAAKRFQDAQREGQRLLQGG